MSRLPHFVRCRGSVLVATVAIAALACAVGAWWWFRSPPTGRIVASLDDPFDDDNPSVRNPGYLGPQACAPCHRERVAEFQETPHFRACRLPEAGTMPAGFAPGRGAFATRDPALRFEMTHTGGDFLQTAIHAVPSGEQRTSTRIDLAYGTGNADEIYFTWHDDRLHELPAAWLHPQNRWGASPFNPYGSGEFSRETTTRCLECHNTWFEHVPGTSNQYKRDSFILGVTCERCHGPGQEHVTFHQAHPDEKIGQSVVHPGHLARDRQLDVCAQCHSNAVKPRTPPFSYRPGEELDAYFRTNVNQRREDDHVANQVRYLRESKCFQKSDTLTCITCHNPHKPKGPSTAAAVQSACLKCHQPADCAEQERLPAAVRSACVNCHMPQFTRIQVFFQTEDDAYLPAIRPHEHRIGVYPAARQEVLLTWRRTQSDAQSRDEAARLTKDLVEHWLAEAETFRRDHRYLAAIGALREAVRIDPAPSTRDKLKEAVAIQSKLDAGLFTAQHQIDEKRFTEAIDTLNGMLSVKPDFAKAHGKLGTAYANIGQREHAVEHLQAVARYDPDDDYGYAMLGWLAILQERYEEAVEYYRQADEIQPFTAKTNYHRGMALAKLDRVPEAADCFRRVLTIDPNHWGAFQGLGDALRRQGKAKEGLRFAYRAAKLTHFENAYVLLTLAETYADAERFEEAEEAASKALEAARVSDPNLEPLIRERLRDFRDRANHAAR